VREIKIEVRLDEASKRVQIRRLDDGAILAVPPDAEWAFLGDSAWTKERALAKFSEGDVQRVTIKSAHGDRAEIARRGEEFDLIQPRGGTADVPLTKHLVDELSHLSAVRFLPSKERPKGGLFEVSWQLAGQTTPSRLWIGKRIRGGFEAWSTLSEGPFVLSTAARDVFETPLVDRSPVRLDPDEFSRITLRAGDRLYSFAREGEVLRATGGQALDDMVTELEEALRALDVVAAAPSGAAELPRRSSPEIVFEGLRGTGDEAESVVLEIGGLGVWQGQGVRGVWRDGKLYLLRAASVTPLIELL
jgi:hypothetical protein